MSNMLYVYNYFTQQQQQKLTNVWRRMFGGELITLCRYQKVVVKRKVLEILIL